MNPLLGVGLCTGSMNRARATVCLHTECVLPRSGRPSRAAPSQHTGWQVAEEERRAEGIGAGTAVWGPGASGTPHTGWAWGLKGG